MMAWGLPVVRVGAQASGRLGSRFPMVTHLSRQSREHHYYDAERRTGKEAWGRPLRNQVLASTVQERNVAA